MSSHLSQKHAIGYVQGCAHPCLDVDLLLLRNILEVGELR